MDTNKHEGGVAGKYGHTPYLLKTISCLFVLIRGSAFCLFDHEWTRMNTKVPPAGAYGHRESRNSRERQ